MKYFYFQAILGYKLSTFKSYEVIVEPSLKMAISSFKHSQLKAIIIHFDNALEFYCHKLKNLIANLNMKLSKKQLNNIGGNALSENWFYHLIVEWFSKWTKYVWNIWNCQKRYWRLYWIL